MKKLLILGASLLLLAACGNGDRSVTKIDHIHDLEFYDDALFIGTHYGLAEVNFQDHEWSWKGNEAQRHDFMGFGIRETGEFLGSGHPSDESDLSDPLGAMLSDDQGETWEVEVLYEEVDFHKIDVNEHDDKIVYGFDSISGAIFRSDNGGESFQQQGDETFNPSEFLDLISNKDDPDQLMLSDQRGVFKSEDAGETWELLSEEPQVFLASTYTNDELLVYSVGQQEMWRTTSDFGQTWENVELPKPSENEPIMALASNEGMLAAGTFDNDLYISNDDGASWELIVEKGEPIE
ncbi:F510_1955 family glycosylhydrolase [Halalkalibacillus halophilus]|uniref:F510_1955 family glycosylhydrolase n=1 Tax=Halalkalibacillus halophilus TaxID=392827 RepID=UPI0004803D64|nr:YCF48-related protein [Halalkalibacillus halophilus]